MNSVVHINICMYIIFIHGKNDFAERSKILLDIDLKIILLSQQNNFTGTLKNNEQCCEKF